MLVLTRKQNEKIRIGNSITITVLRMKGKAVRLGIEAPRDLNVIRGELCFDLSEEETEEATAETGTSTARVSLQKAPRTARQNRATPGNDATDNWPASRQGDRLVAQTIRGAADSTSPLRAMVEARSV